MEINQQSIHYGGFWLRLLASCIDVFILVILIFCIVWWFYGPTAIFSFNQSPLTQKLLQEAQISSVTLPSATVPLWLNITLNWIMPILFTLLFWHFRSATPGKMVCKLKIVDADSLRVPKTSQFIIRYFAYIISTLPLCLGLLWIAWDKRKQAWHDKIAKTVVIIERKTDIL